MLVLFYCIYILSFFYSQMHLFVYGAVLVFGQQVAHYSHSIPLCRASYCCFLHCNARHVTLYNKVSYST